MKWEPLSLEQEDKSYVPAVSMINLCGHVQNSDNQRVLRALWVLATLTRLLCRSAPECVWEREPAIPEP